MLIGLIVFALQIYSLIILARVIMSWIPNLDPTNEIVRGIYKITEPVLRPIREAMPPTMGFDLSPMIVMVGIWVLMSVLGRM